MFPVLRSRRRTQAAERFDDSPDPQSAWSSPDLRPDGPEPTTLDEAVARMAEAEDTLRAIAAGEVDAFVVGDRWQSRRVFTLSTADRPYRMFVENMRDGAATLSPGGVILYANRRLAELLVHPRDTIVGSPLARFLAGGSSLRLDDMHGPDGLGTAVELDLVDSVGTAVPVLVSSSPLDVDGEHLTCVTFTDLRWQRAQDREIVRLSQAQAERMEDLQNAQEALTKQATHDALTGLPNRALVVNRIDRALMIARRTGLCTTVLFVDLDRFKQVNDTHGHAAGDAVLRRVAEQLVSVLRPIDTVARIGGDEFVVLAPDIETHFDAVDIGSRLVAELSLMRERSGGERIAASVGIAVSTAGRGTAEVLLNEADRAMYQAKSLGGSRAEVFDAALAKQVQRRSAAQRMLQAALDDQRVVAYYQPIIDLPSGSVAGFEALARVSREDGTILQPASFISVAEDSGLVVPLGAQVLALACAEAQCWVIPAGHAPLDVSVNLSARQFEPGDLGDLVRQCLATTGLDAHRLHFELTETAIIDLRPDILHQLDEIRDLGVQIGLDDFGTGYASLTHLRRLPLSFVKVDQSFVQGLGTDQSDEGIVSAVISLAANLGLRSIAEGVETPEQLTRLRDLGCDQAQGYLFARPLPARQIDALLAAPVW